MIEIKDVQGSKQASEPLIIGVDTVYVHTNIRPYVDPHPEEGREIKDMYVYDEIQYTKDEYIKILAEDNANCKQQISHLQLAMVSAYKGGK